MKTYGLSSEMKDIVNEIDVSDSDYERAEKRYNSISNYIQESDLSVYEPDIFLQGSFKLGTAIKPLTDDGSYDVDIVCNFLKKNKMGQTQKDLKTDLGNVIKSYATSKGMNNKPEESNRCWTLKYVDVSNFHIDILPSVPWWNSTYTTIAITDKRNENYLSLSNNWEVSDPKGYAAWFKEQGDFQFAKETYAKNVYSSIEEVPDYKVKTPLQRIVQILKRHAEVMFEDNIEFKPTSIIITTLAAKAYRYCAYSSNSFDELLLNVISRIRNEIDYDDGKPCVLNPVNKEEKLSLKWDKDYYYFQAFLDWTEQLNSDFNVEDQNITKAQRLFYIKRSLFKNNKRIGISLDSLAHHEKSKWYQSQNTVEKVKIKAIFSRKGFRSKEIKSGTSIIRNASLKFEVISDNLNKYDIWWQVTNTGGDAIQANCLRGDFYNSTIEQGRKVRKEVTRYIGRHYVEAYLVKDDICYGKSEPFEVNIVR